jgi:RNA polymerase sigma-70 factor, ECF subfamily
MDELAALARDACRRFSQSFEPLRPELYRFCRHLTHSPWDAEDLAQDTLARALVTLGTMLKPEIENPRA